MIKIREVTNLRALREGVRIAVTLIDLVEVGKVADPQGEEGLAKLIIILYHHQIAARIYLLIITSNKRLGFRFSHPNRIKISKKGNIGCFRAAKVQEGQMT